MERCNNNNRCNNRCENRRDDRCNNRWENGFGPIRENKCRKLENCAEDLADMNEELLECVEKKLRDIVCLQKEARELLAKAKCVNDKAEAKTREVQMLVRKLSDMVAKANELFGRAVDCNKRNCRHNRFCKDEHRCCRVFGGTPIDRDDRDDRCDRDDRRDRDDRCDDRRDRDDRCDCFWE